MPGRLRRRLRRSPWLRDVIAGTSVGLVLIPQSMAVAELAGLPAHRGLYAAGLPPLLAAIFASSPYLQTGPVALTALLSLGALVPLAAPGSPEFVALAALLALVVGVTRVAVGLLRAGGISYLMSQPVLQGFTAAAALLIIGSQVPGAFGVAAPGDGVVGSAFWTATHPAEWEAWSVALTVGTVATILLARRKSPLIPGVLIATVGGVAFSVLVGYSGPQIGEVPEWIPDFSLTLPWRRLPALALPGVVIALVGFAEASSISRLFATQDRKPWDPSREFVSQGVANLASGISGGFAVGGSFSRSSLNRLAGARTRWAGAVTGAVVLLFLPISWILSPLPRAVLSAIVIASALNLVRIRPLVRMWKLSRLQALVGWHTFVLTIVLSPHMEQAIVLGIFLALAVHVWREMPLGLASWTDGKTLHLEPKGVLWFGSAPEVERTVFRFFASVSDVERIVVHLGGLGRLDITGALLLQQLLEDAKRAGYEVRLVDAPPHARRILKSVLGWTPGKEGSAVDPGSAAEEAATPREG